MTQDRVVWGRKTSSNVQAVMWCLAELDLPCTRVEAGHRFGGLDSDSFGEMNPNRTIPVLKDGTQKPIWEAGAILRYLAAEYGDGRFWPRDPVARASVDKWAEWAKINVALGFTAPVFWRVVRTAQADQDPVAIRQALDRLEHFLRIAEDQLVSHPFLAGDHLTLADIQFGHVLFRYYDIAIARPDLPHLRSYYVRLSKRSAYQKHVMVSYEDLRVA